MRVLIVFPYNTWGGAFRSTYIYSNELVRRGHSVTIVFPILPITTDYSRKPLSFFYELSRHLFRVLFRMNKIPFEVLGEVKHVLSIRSLYLPKSDIVVANHWITAKSVYALDPVRNGQRFLYVRDVEQWSPRFDVQLEYWRLPLKKITVAKWITDKLSLEYSISVDRTVTNGTDTSPFLVENKIFNAVPRIGVIYAKHPMKDMPTVKAVLDRLSHIHGNEVELVLFGFPSRPKFPFEFEYHHRPTGTRLSNLYQGIDIFLSLSIQEGFHNPPREAMAAQCAVVATNVGCMPDIGKHLQNCLIVPIGDVESILSAITTLLNDKSLLKRIAKQGMIDIQKYSWKEKVDEIENYMMSLVDEN